MIRPVFRATDDGGRAGHFIFPAHATIFTLNWWKTRVMEMLSGGEMIVRALEDEGVEYVFGYPGGAALHIYDALFKADNLPHILVRHE